LFLADGGMLSSEKSVLKRGTRCYIPENGKINNNFLNSISSQYYGLINVHNEEEVMFQIFSNIALRNHGYGKEICERVIS
jgi:hypothetical protein